jgi:hypothetical protein
VKVSPDHGLHEIPLVEEAFDVLLEVFRVLILGRQQVLEDTVLRDLDGAELLVELVITHLDAKVPLRLAIDHRELVDAQGDDSLRQAMNVGEDLIFLLVKGRIWRGRHVLVRFVFYVLQL